MKQRCIQHRLSVLSVLVLAGATIAAGGQSPREVYERARLLEENSRSLPRAVEMYEKVAVAAGADRPLAAAARLRVALVRERQGRPEARALFAAIVRDYADQPQAVAIAKARLAAAAGFGRQSEGTPRRLASSLGYPSAISADGRRALVVTNETTSRLVLQDQDTSQGRTLVQGSDRGWARTPLFSPDGRRVVYSWLQLDRPRGSSPPLPNATTSLQLIGIEPGAGPQTLAGPTTGFFGYIPVGWSGDGSAVLCWMFNGPSNPVSLTSVAVADGTVRTIKTFESWRNVIEGGGAQGPGFRQVSSDGRWIAYSANARQGAADRYIYVMDTAGQNETMVVGSAGVNGRPLWMPDSSTLLFVNEQSGGRGLWAVNVREGRATGDPWLVRRNFNGSLVEVSGNSGDLVYITSEEGGFSEYVAERDPAGARVVQVFRGMSGTWSRGNRLAFLRPQRASSITNSPFDLIIRRMDTGEERAYQHAHLTNVSPRWFSDDSAVVVYVQEQGGAPGSFYRVDVDSGAFTELFRKDTTAHVRSAVGALALDNKTMYLAVRADAQAPWTGIAAVDLATGAERHVMTFPGPGLPGGSALGLVMSPDGTTLAMRAWAEDGSDNGRLMTVRTDGTDFREVFGPVSGGGWSDLLRWTPDGQSLLFSARVVDAAGVRTWEILRVPAQGGAAEREGLNSANLNSDVKLPDIEKNNISSLDVSPDGSRLVFSSSARPTYEVWALDDVSSILKP